MDHHHITELDLPSFAGTVSVENSAITQQPQIVNNDYEVPGVRRPIPISTIGWQSTEETQFIPGDGLESLRGASEIYIQQTMELSDLLANVQSANRYLIKIPRGETLFYASEKSSEQQRLCCGSNRAFEMVLYDQTQQESLKFKRELICGVCSIWFNLQKLDVLDDVNRTLGFIQQKFTFSVPSFTVHTGDGTIIYTIDGPASILSGCCPIGKGAHFKIYSPDGLTQLGSINHHWDQLQSAYNLCLQFPNRRLETKHKALLLGAAFLLEYTYFVNTSKIGICRHC